MWVCTKCWIAPDRPRLRGARASPPSSSPASSRTAHTPAALQLACSLRAAGGVVPRVPPARRACAHCLCEDLCWLGCACSVRLVVHACGRPATSCWVHIASVVVVAPASIAGLLRRNAPTPGVGYASRTPRVVPLPAQVRWQGPAADMVARSAPGRLRRVHRPCTSPRTRRACESTTLPPHPEQSTNVFAWRGVAWPFLGDAPT